MSQPSSAGPARWGCSGYWGRNNTGAPGRGFTSYGGRRCGRDASGSRARSRRTKSTAAARRREQAAIPRQAGRDRSRCRGERGWHGVDPAQAGAQCSSEFGRSTVGGHVRQIRQASLTYPQDGLPKQMPTSHVDQHRAQLLLGRRILPLGGKKRQQQLPARRSGSCRRSTDANTKQDCGSAITLALMCEISQGDSPHLQFA